MADERRAISVDVQVDWINPAKRVAGVSGQVDFKVRDSRRCADVSGQIDFKVPDSRRCAGVSGQIDWAAEDIEVAAVAVQVEYVDPSTIASDPTGASIQASPADLYGISSGTTPLKLVYTDGTQVTLIAGSKVSGRIFLEWRNSSGDALSTSRILTVTSAGGATFTAYYEYVGDAADDWMQAGH